jgi:L-asparaginase II
MPDARRVKPIRIVVHRGGLVEAVHSVHAAAVRDGELVAAAGDPGLVTLMRSAAKPIQALPLVRAYRELDEQQLAIACASHLADRDQLRAVEGLLQIAGATEGDLECGPAGEPPSRLEHNCSGKHAGMLALCRAHGWPTKGYRLPAHPVQRSMLAEVAAATGVSGAELATAVDGCGVVTFALPLERMAVAFARLERLDGGDRIASAMRAQPALIRGADSPDTRLMRTLDGWIAKGGAEAVFCAAAPDGLGVALKVEDGAWRAIGPAVAAFLGALGRDASCLASSPVRNSRGEVVGEIRAQDV